MGTTSFDFRGRVCVVTGGAQGLGLCVSRKLLAAGATASIWDSNEAVLAQATEQLARECEAWRDRQAPVVVDVTDPRRVDEAAAITEQRQGRIDVLINNAALVGPIGPLWEYPIDAWESVLRVGLTGTFHCCRSVVPIMLRNGYGRILNVSSVAGKEGNANAAAYSACKAGVIALTKSLGKELAAFDISVNCVTPSIAETPGAMGQTAEHIRAGLAKVPRNRYLAAEEAADMFAWIVSEENSFATGAVFDLSGGRATY